MRQTVKLQPMEVGKKGKLYQATTLKEKRKEKKGWEKKKKRKQSTVLSTAEKKKKTEKYFEKSYRSYIIIYIYM